jgi:3'-5' exonuclease
MCDFAAFTGGRVNEICSVLGFPEKFEFDGSQILTMPDNNQINEIRNYCETDVLNTYVVYLRHMTIGEPYARIAITKPSVI